MDARSRPSLLGLVVLALVVAVAAVTAWAWLRPRPAEQVVDLGVVPDFALTERSGRAVTRADLLGKVSVVDFFYTRCTDTCPLQSAHLARLQGELAGAPDAQLISITVDPEHDDLQVLSAYAAQFKADPQRWLFLTGPRDAIYRLAVDGFHLAVVASQSRPAPAPARGWLAPPSAWAHEGEKAEPAAIQLAHAARFAVVDRQGRIRNYFDGTRWEEVERMRGELDRLLARR
jgi:protein SCO1/2